MCRRDRGITCLNITVKSEHKYGNNQTTEETLKILINVSSKELIDIPNYIKDVYKRQL